MSEGTGSYLALTLAVMVELQLRMTVQTEDYGQHGLHPYFDQPVGWGETSSGRTTVWLCIRRDERQNTLLTICGFTVETVVGCGLVYRVKNLRLRCGC